MGLKQGGMGQGLRQREARRVHLMPPFREGEHCVRHDHVCAANTVRTPVMAPVTNIDSCRRRGATHSAASNRGLFTCLQ